MVRTAIQLQSLQDLPESVPETIARIGSTALEGVELFDRDVTSASAVSTALDDAGLEPVGAHVHVDRLENELDDVVETYETIGCRRLIVPILHGVDFGSRDGIEAVADRLSRIETEVSDRGFELFYHNNHFEFERVQGRLGYDLLIEAMDDGIGLELDTGLAIFGGADPVDLLSRHGDRIRMLHLTDAVPGRETTKQVELGAGELDVEACVETARNSDVEWVVYEHGMTADPRDSLTHAATKLPSLAQGREGTVGTNPLSSHD